jgi:hypothetical protein
LSGGSAPAWHGYFIREFRQPSAKGRIVVLWMPPARKMGNLLKPLSGRGRPPEARYQNLAAQALGSGAAMHDRDSFYYRAIRTKIGDALRAQYDLSPLPHTFLAILMQLDEKARENAPRAPMPGSR